MYKFAALVSSLITLILLTPGCQPSGKDDSAADAVSMVPKELQSPAFEPVAQNLDLGGDLYFFMDPTAMVSRLEASIPRMIDGVTQMPNSQLSPETMAKLKAVDWSSVLKDLGYSDHTAFGVSSYGMADGNYRNKSMVYLPDGYQGLMKMYEGDDGALDGQLSLAPQDTDVFYSVGLDLTMLKPFINDFLGKYVGKDIQQQYADAIVAPVSPDGLTVSQIWDNIPKRLTLLVKFGDLIAYPMPSSKKGMVMLPKIDLVLALQGNSAFWRGLIEKQLPPNFKEETVGEVALRMPAPGMPLPFGLTPAIGFDDANDRIYVTTSELYLKNALSDGPRLSDSPAYADAVKGLQTEDAQDMIFLSQNFYSKWAETREGITADEPMAGFMIAIYSMYLPIIQAGPHDSATALVMLRTPKGLITEANWAYSPSLAGLNMGSGSQTVVVGGLLAAMAIPAFNKVREQSREKAIINNLRQVSAAGQQYILENGVPKAPFEVINGEYFSEIVPVAGEDYTGLVVEEEGGTLSVTTADGKTVTYTY